MVCNEDRSVSSEDAQWSIELQLSVSTSLSPDVILVVQTKPFLVSFMNQRPRLTRSPITRISPLTDASTAVGIGESVKTKNAKKAVMRLPSRSSLLRGLRVKPALFGSREDRKGRNREAREEGNVGCSCRQILIPVPLQLQRQFRAARPRNPAIGQHMHKIRLHIIEQALVMRDQ
jgi:hypothetical protein